MSGLNRTLGLGECIFFGVGSILGAGIYALIGKVAGLSGNFIWLSFLIAAACAMFTSFSYAELSASMPKSGGEYTYAKKAFGKNTGSIIGLLISFTGIISGATVAIGFAGYLGSLTGIDPTWGALGIIAFLFAVNMKGIQESSLMNIIFTLIEAGGLIFVIVTAIPFWGKTDLTSGHVEGINGIFGASALAFFAYIGFEEIVKLAEETKNPEKTIPRALFITGAIVVVLYILVAISAVSVVDSQTLAASKSPLSDIIAITFGPSGMIVISIIALFSTSNTILSNMLGSSRVILNMAKDSKRFHFMSFVSPKTKTPVASLILIFIITSALSLIGKIQVIAGITTLFIFVTFLAVNLAVIVLRIKAVDMERPYRIPFNIKNIPIISVAALITNFILMGFAAFYLFK